MGSGLLEERCESRFLQSVLTIEIASNQEFVTSDLSQNNGY